MNLLLICAVAVGCGSPIDPGPGLDNRLPQDSVRKTGIALRVISLSEAQVGDVLLLRAVVVDSSSGSQNPAWGIQWSSLDPEVGLVDQKGAFSAVRAGEAEVVATAGGLTTTIVIRVSERAIAGGTVSPELKAVLGPLEPRGGAREPAVVRLDAMFQAAEQATYQTQFRVQLPRTTGTQANHYGALRSRLQWAIRNGLPWGPGATDPDSYMYGRGRHIVLHYLTSYAKPNHHAIQPHNNTGLADVELLWWLERVPEARDHIWVTAQGATQRDRWGYYDLTSTSSDGRWVSVALQSLNAAHRMGIPFEKSHAAPAARGFNSVGAGSWQGAGEILIEAILAGGSVHPDGTVNSPAHQSSGQCGRAAVCEAYFMSAMLATELLRWHGFVAPHPAAYAAALQIGDHLIAELARHGSACLPYLSSGSGCSEDLAAFYVWPALVLWQETGDTRYRDFALTNLRAAEGAYVRSIKQFNQAFSTGAQNAEALLSGEPWR